MAFKIIKKAPTNQIPEPTPEILPTVDPKYVESHFPVKPIKRASADDIPNYCADLLGHKCRLYLASNNDLTRTYAVYCSGWWIGNLTTGGSEHAACKVLVPKDYGDLGSKAKFTPTGVNMGDGISLLMKAAGVIEGTPLAPGQKPKIKLAGH
ncbi:hypothetical protein R21Y_109 [Vibrio phage vB_VhaS_R21Y]|nr:hypothetical protein R21Y_109 [Vibrio phage vB_VhaS_R21Y]